MILLREIHTVDNPSSQWPTRPGKRKGTLQVRMDKASQLAGEDQVLHMFISSPDVSGEWYVPVMFIGGQVKVGKPQMPMGQGPEIEPELVQRIAKEKAEEIVAKSSATTQKMPTVSESEFATRVLLRILNESVL